MESHCAAVIVSGGHGKRMEHETAKQFLPLVGKPIVFHTLEAFIHSIHQPRLYLVLHEDHFEDWRQLCSKFHWDPPVQVVRGGKCRSESVWCGLQAIKEDNQHSFPELVAVHDAARPLVSPQLIDCCFEMAKIFGSAVPTLPLQDSLRALTPGGSYSVERTGYCTVQTPQVFDGLDLWQAYQQTHGQEFSDDAAVWDHCGKSIHLVQGERKNIKITFPIDIDLASALLARSR